jgi:lantibiotic modifying enzyme
VSAGRARFLNAAERIGWRLCRDAVWSNGRCSWLGWAMEPHAGQWKTTVFRAVGSTLYEGASGIGLFLARLANLWR